MALALLFDLDGTLFDTFEQILEAQNAAVAEAGVRPLTREELRPLVGMPVSRQLKILRGMEGPPVAAITESYYRRFEAMVRRHVELYPGVKATFPTLKGRRIGTMSTRRRDVADLMLRVAGIRDYFTTVTGGDEVARAKPEPDLPWHAAKAIGAAPSETVVVGDAAVDILAGRAAGMRTLAVTYGYGDLAAIREARPHAEIPSFDRLPGVVAAFERDTRDLPPETP